MAMVHFEVHQPGPGSWTVTAVPTPGAMLVPGRSFNAGVPVCACRWSPDGTMLAVGFDDDRLLVLPADELCGGEAHQVDELLAVTMPDEIDSIAWSPDSRELLVTSGKSIDVVAVPAGRITRRVAYGHRSAHAAWSPDAGLVAVGDRQGFTVRDASSLAVVSKAPSIQINVSVSWSPTGELATGDWGEERLAVVSLQLWTIVDGRLEERWRVTDPHGEFGHVTSLAFLPSGQELVTVGTDGAVRVWDASSGALLRRLERDRGFPVAIAVTVSADGTLIMVQDQVEVTLWSATTWTRIGHVALGSAGPKGDGHCAGLRPGRLHYAIGSDDRLVVLDLSEVDLADAAETGGVQYRNAKIVVVGDSGVGKSGLSMVLAGRVYEPTSATHGRQVHHFGRHEVAVAPGWTETREAVLWDLAGQPGYRLFHRLSLHDVAVALVLFDAGDESEPFAGVAYWACAVDEAARGRPGIKLLVAARTDRGGPAVSRERIDDIVRRYGFAGYAETSALHGWGVAELRETITRAIPWGSLPVISAPEVFLDVHRFLDQEKAAGRLLDSPDRLRERFDDGADALVEPALFDVCLRRQAAAGLVAHLTFARLWLLRPEVLDSYAMWLGHAARDEPDGLGFLPVQAALAGDFRRQAVESVPDDRLMLLAAVEEVVGRGLALRVATERGDMLVFPSEVRADLPDDPGGYVLAMAFSFHGPVKAVYATITVRLANSLTFQRHHLYRNAALFRGPRQQVCGLAAHYPRPADESVGRMVVFHDPRTEKDIALLFLRYIHEQLQQLALPGSVVRERIYQCPHGDPPVPAHFVELRRSRGETTVICPGCGQHLPMDDLAEESTRPDERVEAMDRNAADQQRRQQRLTVLSERTSQSRYHVFLCHNSRDKPAVRELARRLRDEGVLAWLDEDNILAGDQPVPSMDELLGTVPAVAVTIGRHSLGRWQKQEYYAFLHRFVEQRENGGEPLLLIPVLLPGAPDPGKLPPFLRTFHRVDFRQGGLGDPDAMRALLQALQ
jgi:hypothetical protein